LFLKDVKQKGCSASADIGFFFGAITPDPFSLIGRKVYYPAVTTMRKNDSGSVNTSKL
jgi:hypothetical protein